MRAKASPSKQKKAKASPSKHKQAEASKSNQKQMQDWEGRKEHHSISCKLRHGPLSPWASINEPMREQAPQKSSQTHAKVTRTNKIRKEQARETKSKQPQARAEHLHFGSSGGRFEPQNHFQWLRLCRALLSSGYETRFGTFGSRLDHVSLLFLPCK